MEWTSCPRSADLNSITVTNRLPNKNRKDIAYDLRPNTVIGGVAIAAAESIAKSHSRMPVDGALRQSLSQQPVAREARQ